MIPSTQLMITHMSQVSLSLVRHRLLVFQPIPKRALEVLKNGGFENKAVRPPWNSSWGMKPVEELL